MTVNELIEKWEKELIELKQNDGQYDNCIRKTLSDCISDLKSLPALPARMSDEQTYTSDQISEAFRKEEIYYSIGYLNKILNRQQ